MPSFFDKQEEYKDHNIYISLAPSITGGRIHDGAVDGQILPRPDSSAKFAQVNVTIQLLEMYNDVHSEQ